MNRDDIINKVFPHSLFGYDPVAVDAFLDEVIREFDRMNNTIDVLRLKLSQELGEAMEVNEMLTGELVRGGIIMRVKELMPGDKEALPGETVVSAEENTAADEAAPEEAEAPVKAEEEEEKPKPEDELSDCKEENSEE